MSVAGELLFYRSNSADLDDVLRHQASYGLGQVVDAIPEASFAAHSDEALADRLAAQQAMKPLAVEFEKAEPQVASTNVEVHHFGRMSSVKGYRITKTIPFSGDPQLWHLKPNPANLSPPRGDVRGGRLVIGIELPEAEAEQRAAAYFDSTVASIREYLGWQAAQIERYNAGLSAQALPLIQRRRQHLDKGAALLRSLKG